MITYVKGDVRTTDAPFIVHGCNAQGAMGSGVARALFEKWPRVKTDYETWMKARRDAGHDSLPMGISQYVMIKEEPRQYVVNMITQDYYGRDGSKYVSYDAVDRGMLGLLEHCDYLVDKGIVKAPLVIAMPKIGAGLGGGHWPVIETIINHRLASVDVRVYEIL